MGRIYICFIDYEAFDRVKHAKIIECMENLDIDRKDISLIRNLYWNQKAYMRTEDGLSPEIHIKRGVRPGCVLSPCLFNLLSVHRKHLWSNEYQQRHKDWWNNNK